MNIIRRTIAPAAATLLLASPAVAQVQFLTADGTNSTSGTFQTSSRSLFDVTQLTGSGNTYYYLAVPWTTAASATYTFGQTQSANDTILMLYQGVFDPANPGVGAMTLNDDTLTISHQTALGDNVIVPNCSRDDLCPQITQALSINTRYTLVISTYRNSVQLGSSQTFYAIGQGAFSATPLAPAVSATNTALATMSAAGAVRERLSLRQAELATLLTYDSATFGPQGYSVSFVGRASSLADRMGAGAGGLVLSHRFTPELRAGVFIDKGVARDRNGVLRESDPRPSFGGFLAYQQNADASGWVGRVAVAASQNRLSITRNASLSSTEPGSGEANVRGRAASLEAGYGFALDSFGLPSWIATPYAGLRVSTMRRGAYSEATSDAVTKPLSYDAYDQRFTTATAGLRVAGRVSDKIGLSFGLGAEYDVARKIRAYSGVSDVTNLNAFAMTATDYNRRARLSAQAGLTYQIAANQSLSADFAIRQTPFAHRAYRASMLRYSVGF